MTSIRIYGKELIYRAVYELDELYSYKGDDFEPDINNEKSEMRFRKDILRLELYPDSSFCYSYYTWFTDSLQMQPNGDKLWDEIFRATYKPGYKGEPLYPHKRNTFQIIKNRTKGNMTVYDFFDGENYIYEDSLPDFNWNITDSTATKSGYESVLALCTSHGRDWNVWFSPELPWQDGPWKFSSLPGLVIEASDAEKFYTFRLKEISQLDNPIQPWVRNPKKTTCIKFIEDRFQYLKTLDGGSILEAEFGIATNQSRNKSQRYRIGLEKNYNRK